MGTVAVLWSFATSSSKKAVAGLPCGVIVWQSFASQPNMP